MFLNQYKLNETPLHFATKFGSYEVARLLMSNDICQKMALNKFGKTPKDVICTKVSNNQKYELINALFEKCYFVPIYRDDDKGDVLIDKPSPKLATTLDAQNNLIDNLNRASNFGTASPSKYSQKKLAGYVGPVSPSVVIKFFCRLLTPQTYVFLRKLRTLITFRCNLNQFGCSIVYFKANNLKNYLFFKSK